MPTVALTADNRPSTIAVRRTIAVSKPGVIVKIEAATTYAISKGWFNRLESNSISLLSCCEINPTCQY